VTRQHIRDYTVAKVGLKVKVNSGTCYSASYMGRIRDQKRFYKLKSGSWLA